MTAGGRVGDDWVERVRAASDIVEIVGQSVPLKRTGRNWMGLCPFHQEKTPSFSVNAERQFYHCFSCKAGGDVFRFVMESEKVGFLEAVELLSRRAGIAVPERRGGESGRRGPLLEALDAAASAYEAWLGDPGMGGAARAYLERRGITRETSRLFRLGFAPAGWENLTARLRGRFADDVLLEARLAGRREGARSIYDFFRNRLVVPLVAPGGAVLGFGARTMGDETPKYLNSPESPVYHKSQFLFALEQARRHVKPDGELIVVEGYFDAIALHQAGLRNTVATSGTALTADHARQLRRLASGVALTFDGDAAGQDAMLRSLGVLLAEGLAVVVVELPAGDDPDTLVRREGEAGWARVRASAYDAVAFVHRHVLNRGGLGNASERALQTLVRLLAGVDDPIRQQALAFRAAEEMGGLLSNQNGAADQVILHAVRAARTGRPDAGPAPAALGAQRLRERTLERLVLAALLRVPDALDWARAELAPEDFSVGAERDLAGALWRGDDPVAADAPAAGLARELAIEEIEGFDWASEAQGAVRKLKVRCLERDRRERRTRLASAQGDEAQRLTSEINELSKQIHELTR
ncbi:MAG TPA: DNA primase [Candidatus Acidoferrales bacterium]|nr:DNA primase [Candidatus Acidoferrales bacterium]